MHNVRQYEYLKTDRGPFPEKFNFAQIWAKGAQNRIFWIFWKILSLVFPRNIDISPQISYLEKLWFSSFWPKSCQPIKLQNPLNVISQRSDWCNLNIEVFYKLVLSFWVNIAKHARSIKNKKFVCLCNLYQKTWGLKLIFLPADKHKSFLQVHSITVGIRSQAYAKYPKQQVCNIFAVSQGKYEEWVCFFCMQIIIKSFWKLILLS